MSVEDTKKINPIARDQSFHLTGAHVLRKATCGLLSFSAAEEQRVQKLLVMNGVSTDTLSLSDIDAKNFPSDQKNLIKPYAIFIIVSDELPAHIPTPSGNPLKIWMSLKPQIKKEHAEKVDYALSFDEFTRSPDWYCSYFLKSIQRKEEKSETEFLETIRQLTLVNERLQRLSITDDLTLLANHRHFVRVLHEEVERASRYRLPMTLMMIDIDHFKNINDTFGHLAGDEALIHIAGELKKAVRRVDTVSRYGGEEFAIILPMTGSQQACDLGQRIVTQVAQSRWIPSHNVFHTPTSTQLTISMGIASFPEHAETADVLLKQADHALYHSKNHGRNQLTMAAAPERKT